jgi:hypothetical protein
MPAKQLEQASGRTWPLKPAKFRFSAEKVFSPCGDGLRVLPPSRMIKKAASLLRLQACEILAPRRDKPTSP